MYFGEKKSFTLHAFARKTKQSSYKVAAKSSKLSRLFNVLLNLN